MCVYLAVALLSLLSASSSFIITFFFLLFYALPSFFFFVVVVVFLSLNMPLFFFSSVQRMYSCIYKAENPSTFQSPVTFPKVVNVAQEKRQGKSKQARKEQCCRYFLSSFFFFFSCLPVSVRVCAGSLGNSLLLLLFVS